MGDDCAISPDPYQDNPPSPPPNVAAEVGVPLFYFLFKFKVDVQIRPLTLPQKVV